MFSCHGTEQLYEIPVMSLCRPLYMNKLHAQGTTSTFLRGTNPLLNMLVLLLIQLFQHLHIQGITFKITKAAQDESAQPLAYTQRGLCDIESSPRQVHTIKTK